MEKDGIKLLFDFSQTICRAENHLYGTEAEDWDFLKQFISGSGTILDIGANVGVFSIMFKKLFPNAEVYAFEPVPRTFAFLQRNLELNGMDGKVNAFNIGISDENAEKTFFVPPTNEAASLRPVNDEFYMREGNVGQKEIKTSLEEVPCKVRTLDDFVNEHGIGSSCDFIKIDVEGAELFALKGGIEFIKRTKPVIYCEMLRKHAARFGYHPNDIISLMKDAGYSCHELSEGKLVPFSMMTETTAQTNFFFLPADSAFVK